MKAPLKRNILRKSAALTRNITVFQKQRLMLRTNTFFQLKLNA